MYRFIAAARGRCTNPSVHRFKPYGYVCDSVQKMLDRGRGPVAGLTKAGYRLTKPDVMPVIFFGIQIAAAPFYPGYSFSQESVSMLRTHFSRHPWMFNYSVCLPHPAEN
jgi:hypothetical protein